MCSIFAGEKIGELKKNKLKEQMLNIEISKLEYIEKKVLQTNKNIKQISNHFSKTQSKQQNIRLILKEIQSITDLVSYCNQDNITYRQFVNGKDYDKKLQQMSFRQNMKMYQQKIQMLKNHLLVLEQTMQYFQKHQKELNTNTKLYQFQQIQFLDHYLIVQTEKQKINQNLLQKIKKRKPRIFENKPGKQNTCPTKNLTLAQKQMQCQKIEIKDEFISQNINRMIKKIQTKIKKQNQVNQKIKLSIQQKKKLLRLMSIESKIFSQNHFLVNLSEYKQYFQSLRKSIQSLDIQRLHFQQNYRKKRSKSCVLLQKNCTNILKSIIFQDDSFLEEDSFITNCNYFSSQKFIENVLEHKV